MNELRRDGLDVERWNMLHPGETPRTSWVTEQLARHQGPVVSATDYIKTYSEQIRPFIPAGRRFVALGTDGYGRSDTREKLREFFEVDRRYVTIAALKALADDGAIEQSVVAKAITSLSIDPEKPNPTTV